ncbi:hypothetical protein ABLN72_03160 [Mycobacterium tuberculosis]
MKRFRVFRAPLHQHFHCFRIYRETLSRFSCAASAVRWLARPQPC